MKHNLIIFSLLLLVCCAGCGTKNKVDVPEKPIVIVFENDVHCAVDGYAKLVSLCEEVSRKATLANRKLEEMKHNMMNAIRIIKYAFIPSKWIELGVLDKR